MSDVILNAIGADTMLKQATAIALECSVTLDEMCRLLATVQPNLARAMADHLETFSQALVNSAMPDDWLRSVHEMTAKMLDERRAKLLPPES